MNLRRDLLEGIQGLLDLLPPKTVRRGRNYFRDGAVIALECVEPDHLYAAVVQGEDSYEVGLEFEDGEWAGECSCPVSWDCKHFVAALLALRQRATGEGNEAVRSLTAAQRQQIAKAIGLPWREVEASLATTKKQATGGPRPIGEARIRQPPRSPLCDKLVAHLGRDLGREEAQFIRKIQNLFASEGASVLTESDLTSIAGCQIAYYGWQPLEIWPDFPPDDYHFWLFMARELRRRSWTFPEFMEGITDLSVIEPAVRKWEREKEIEQWKNRFRELEGHKPAAESGVLDLRLAILPDEARLQWRNDAKLGFAEFKQAHAKKFAEQLEQGTLTLAPESLPLWSAIYRPWHYENWWSFKYSNATARPVLNRLLRMALAPDRVVTADGQLLPRVAEPLRLNLRRSEGGVGPVSPETLRACEQLADRREGFPATDDDADYEIRLTTADGSPAPRIFCALRGQPTLYVTARGLFTGPSATLLDSDACIRIPAPALETPDGLRFLHTAAVPMPEHLARRIKTVPVVVNISCGVKSPYPGCQTENLILSVMAKAPGMETERFTPQGWQATYRASAENFFGRAPKSKTPRRDAEAAGAVIHVHDRAPQRHLPRVLEGLPDLKFGGYENEWFLRLTRKTPELFVSWLKSLPPEIEVLLDPELATLRDAPLSGDVSLDVAEAGIDWFDLKVMLNVSDATLTPGELQLLLNARGGYVRLGKKGWRRLQFNLTAEDDEQLARLGLDARDFSAEPQRFHALQLADDAAKRFLAPERVEKIQRRVGELKLRVAPPLPPVISAEMRSYQIDGFHFLAYLTANRFGGVLADDMGLGKTLQTLAWLAWLRDGALAIASLVVCPKSVMDNWRAEAARFYPTLRVRLWRGEDATELSAASKEFDLIVVNYAQLRALSPDIARIIWLAVVLDEAQYIKNPDSQTAQAARALQAGHRLALTGTPIENRLLDLWSIFGFAMPGALGNRAHFLRRFNGKEDPLARRRLAARVRPFLLRRTKSQVAKDLPDRIEEELICEMEGKQQTLYRAELKRARQLILGLNTNQQLNKERFNILTSLLRLRQICCHPALVDGKLREAESAKVSALEDLLEPLMEEGHKVLVFSQFVTMLDLLREKVTHHEWPHFYLAGDTENRGELVQEFQSAPGGAVFLISLKAGGFGLNLTAASYVVLFDPWWNPAVENQAIDRTHRIGQTSKVMAYRLLMRNSIEEKIRVLQKQKSALAGDVLGEERLAQSLTLDDLRFLFSE